jgi:lipopolysaccharide export system permease protein
VVATALTVSVLAAQGELIGMRSLGIPALRALSPILIVCAVLVPLFFLFTDQVVPRARSLTDYLNETQIKNQSVTDAIAEVWFRDGDSFVEADLFEPETGIARNLTIYEMGSNGLPASRADAKSALRLGGGLWRLRGHIRIETRGENVHYADAEPIVRLGDTLSPEETDSRHLSVDELRYAIGELEERGIDTTSFLVDLYVKFANPLACLILPALALFYALGGPPHPSPAATLVFSAAVAAGYTLLTGLSASLGYGATLPPMMAGFAPVAVGAGAATYLGLRLSVMR